MNKLTKAQLQKVSIACLDNFDEQNQKFFIPRFKKDRYEIGKNYLVCLDDTLLNIECNQILVSNWNKNTIPPCKYMNVNVVKTMGRMIYIDGIGFDIDNNKNINKIWSGWLPIQLTKQIKTL